MKDLIKQNTYVKISNEIHPKQASVKIFYSKLNEPDKLDFKIIDEIIEINKEIGKIDMGGEWKFHNNITRKDYVTALHNHDKQKLAKLLPSLFQNQCSSAMISPSINIVKDFNLSSQMCWDLDALAEFSESKYKYSFLDTPKIGSPFGLNIEGYKILPDSARHLFFAEKVKNLAYKNKNKDNVLEIGGGYGGLIYFLKKLNYKETYFNIDIPESLYVCYYYLRKNNINCEFLTGKKAIKKDTVYLIPSSVYKDVVKNINFNIFFNSASLSEMDKEVCFGYLKMVNKKRPKYIFHCNSNYLAFPDSKIHIEVLAKNFPIDPNLYNIVYKHISPFQGASGRYRIFLYELN